MQFIVKLRNLVSNMDKLIATMSALDTEMHTQRCYLGHAHLHIRDLQDEIKLLKERQND